MLYVSFVEIFQKAFASIETDFEPGAALGITSLCFFCGMGLTWVLELIVHRMMHWANARALGHSDSHDLPAVPAAVAVANMESGAADEDELNKEELKSSALLTMLAIALHNFPEGLATFILTLTEPSLGIALAVAIAVHNVPEGMAVAMPVYYSTGSKWKGFWWATLSGVSEPVGGIIGWLVLRDVLTDIGLGIVFAIVGGMMVFIVIHEMLPLAVRYEKE
jgi:ZIP family zinc transporter